MRMTRETDYALRIMALLAQGYGDRAVSDAKTVADRVGVPQRFAVKIFRKLMSAGLIRSYKGAGGGYALALEPEKITVRQIVEVTEGPLTISLCLSDGFECNRGDDAKTTCYFYHLFDDINAEIAGRLERITLSDVLK